MRRSRKEKQRTEETKQTVTIDTPDQAPWEEIEYTEELGIVPPMEGLVIRRPR